MSNNSLRLFFIDKLRDFKWSSILTVIIMIGVFSWSVTYSTSSDLTTSIAKYSEISTYIRVYKVPEFPSQPSYIPPIPVNFINAVKSIQHVEKVYEVYEFYIILVKYNVTLTIDGKLTNISKFYQGIQAAILGLNELPPFMTRIKSGDLPRPNEPEIAVTEGVEEELSNQTEVMLDPTSEPIKVRVSGLLINSLLSPANALIRKDVLLIMPGGQRILEEAESGNCTALFVKVDDIHNVNEVVENLYELAEHEDSGLHMIYDEYSLQETLKLTSVSGILLSTLNYITLSLLAGLVTLVSYLSFSARRWELGLLRSLGFSRKELIRTYLLYSFTISIIGWIISLTLTYIVGGTFERVLLEAFGVKVDVMEVKTSTFPLSIALLGFLLAVSITIISGLITLSLALRRPIEEDLREF